MKSSKNIFSIKNKVCVITGGCGGIGSVLTKAIYKNGGKIIILDKIKNTKLMKKNITFYRCDLQDESSIKKIVEEIVKKYKNIDCLINAVGISNENSFKDNININLIAVYNLTKLISENMKKKGGSVINITSLNAELGFSKNPGYVSSKGGLKLLTKSFCIDYAKYKIRFNNLGPGYIKTKMTRKKFLNLKERKKRIDRIPLGRYGNPEDLIGPVLFLLSDASSYITGQDIYVDGGFLAKGI